jgi:hypothetical protein
MERTHQPAEVDPTGEVASEGGGPGDVEIERRRPPAGGSEKSETWRPPPERHDEVKRDETGRGRRSP